jgi:triacylglycerol lipase
MHVVMVHGFANTGRLFRRMSEGLEARGHRCLAPTLHPRDGRLGIPDLSGKVAAFIEENVEPGEPIAMVGFSMGALVARHYLQALGGARRAMAFFSISGPHRGTSTAYLYPGEGTRQMRYGSAFLRGLEEGRPGLDGLSLHTYRTPLDLLVVPSTSCRISMAPELVVWCPLHSMMAGNPRVVEHIADELSRLETPGARS